MLVKQISISEKVIFVSALVVTVLSSLLAFYFDEYALLAIPFGIALAVWCLIDVKQVFYFLLLLLPLSTEYYFKNGYATDLPTEPVMVMLMFAFILYVSYRPAVISFAIFKNPIMWFLLLHFFWICITSLNSIQPFLSMKYTLAKTWYIVVFVFLAGAVLKDLNSIKKFFWCIYLPLLVIVLVSIVRFALLGFEFEFVNEPLHPFFRNKVNYATMLSLFYPFLFAAAQWYEKGTAKRRIIQAGKIIFIAGIYFSYTRAAYLALTVATVFVIIVHAKLVKPAVVLGLVMMVFVSYYFVHNNKYLNYSPDFQKTVHHDAWADHLVSTFRGEDASSMERIHMWIGGIFMSTHSPWLGSGPNTFYPEYKRYTVSRFETYLSDNDEHLTIHNYFLLMLVEQGVVGMLLWLALVISFYVVAEKTYHQLKNQHLKLWCLCSIALHTVMMVSLSLSDLVEVDKSGSLFFMNLALMVNLRLMAKKELVEANS